MNGMLNFPGFPMPSMFPPGMMGAGPMAAGWQQQAGDGAGGVGPMRRNGMGGPGGGRFQNRAGPYDRRQNPRWDGGMGNGMMAMRGRLAAPGGRWGDGAAGGAAMGPREAVQGRTIKSYEDLDQAAGGGGGGELNY
jgi:hypothetical protein